MREATVTVSGISPLSWSRYLDTTTLEGESKQDMEERIWRDRFWSDADGQLFVPTMAIKNGLVDAAKYLGEKIPGKGNKTWTGKFEAGILAFEPMSLGVDKAALNRLWIPVPGSPGKGKRGTGARVLKCFPELLQWGGQAKVYIVDDIITAKVFEQYFQALGKFVGWGRFRVASNGYYGRFNVTKVDIKNVAG